MAELWLLLAVLGLPLLSSDVAQLLVACQLFVLGLGMVLIGGRALADHRRHNARPSRLEDADTAELRRVYVGKRRRPMRLTLRPGNATDLTRRADTEARRRLAEQDPGDGEGGLPPVTWRIREEAQRG